MPPARQEESREWLLLPEPLTDEVLRRRRLRRRNALIAIVGVWIAAAALWALAPRGAAVMTWVLVTLAPVVPGVWVGYRAQTPYGRSRCVRLWRALWLVCACWAVGYVVILSFAGPIYPWNGRGLSLLVSVLGIVEGLAGVGIQVFGLFMLGTGVGRFWLLQYASFRSIDLHDRDLSGFDFPGGNLAEANLMNSCLAGANLERTTLDHAVACGASLRGANCRDTLLRGAYLAGADLRDADLRWANLREANLTGADLRGANLSGTRLAGATLTGALYDKYTHWPGPLDPEDHGAVKVD